MKIYLDACCLNRPFDDQTQDRIHLEAEAVLSIIQHVEQHDWQWVSSDAIAYEISKTSDEDRQNKLWALESRATEILDLTDAILQHAQTIQQLGFTSYDALHLAFAISADVDIFLSTDDKLLKRAHRYPEVIKITVSNPLSWLQEII
ncbi:MAG: PIN domain-containing protein [Thiolinea sp.]